MKKIYFVMFLTLLLIPLISWAGPETDSNYVPPLINPLGEGTTLMKIIESVFKWLARFAVVIAPLFIIWGAFLMLTSAGNAERFNSGKKAILYAVIGLIVVLMARGVVAIVTSAFSKNT